MPKFLTPLALEAFLAEERAKHDAQETSHVKYEHTTEFNSDLQDGATARHLEVTEQWVVGYDQLELDSALKSLYHWEPMLQFVRGVLGQCVHLSSDPMNKLHLNRYLPGDSIGWHHDKSEFFFNLILQQPTSGGQFEYVHASAGKHELVQRVVEEGERDQVQAPLLDGGTVVIFRGKENLHRVTACEGERSRITTIFNYASEEGGGMLDDRTRQLFFGERRAASVNAYVDGRNVLSDHTH